MQKYDWPSETAKYRHLTEGYCYNAEGEPGTGVDIASQGDPVVPWAMNFELPEAEFSFYNNGHKPRGPVQLSGDARKLPFNDLSLDFVYSSHLLEDFADWAPILQEWVRPIKPGGHLIILVPDKELWQKALGNGQPPNDAHRHESYAGELTTYAESLGLTVLQDKLTNLWPGDYSVLFVGRRK